MGYIVLEGGSEFGGQMAAPDKLAIELAGGSDAPVRIIPAAAAPDNNHERAGGFGAGWFLGLGATNVASVPLIDRESADDPDIARILSTSSLIYLLGGFPGHLAESLIGSRSWEAVLSAYEGGAVIAGSSAGAMILCEHYYSPRSSQARDGLSLLPSMCVLPHHNRSGEKWATRLAELLPDSILLGIDEETGIVIGETDETGRVLGWGRLTVYHRGSIERIGPNEEFEGSRIYPPK